MTTPILSPRPASGNPLPVEHVSRAAPDVGVDAHPHDVQARPKYLDKGALLALDLDPAELESLLRDSPITGHGGRPVVEADRLGELLAMIRRGDRP